MKKAHFTDAILLIMICTLFIIACKEDEEPEHTDPSFLVGTWKTQTGLPEFTISSDYKFVCKVMMPSMENGLAEATGRLDYTSSGLGPNDYMLRDMAAAAENTPGNNALGGQIGGFNNILATLTPNGDKTQFTFSSTNPIAHAFFAANGAFTKQPVP